MNYRKKGYTYQIALWVMIIRHIIFQMYTHLTRIDFLPQKKRLLKTQAPEYFSELQQNLQTDISKHYLNAQNQGCKDVIWSNEGLYLLNSIEEYQRLHQLFDKHSSEVVCVCCIREPESYRASYMEQLRKSGIGFSDDKDSYRYFGSASNSKCCLTCSVDSMQSSSISCLEYFPEGSV